MVKGVIILLIVSYIVLGFRNQFKTTTYQFPELKFFPDMPVSDRNPVTVEGAELGRRLFYDSILSVDYSMSCASCHDQKAAFSDSPNAFSRGRNETLMKRNTMPLFNLAWYPAFFWDGRAGTIEDQIFHPLREYNEMNLDWGIASQRLQKNDFYKKRFKQVFDKSKIDSVQIAYAIAQFLRTLISYQSKYDQVISGKALFTKEEFEGFILINEQTKGDCIHCHITDGDVLGTTLTFSNNGLDFVTNVNDYKDKGRGIVTGQKSDNGKFRVPSLRNLAFTSPYMHDGRFNTLEDVLDFYSEGLQHSPNVDSKMEFIHQGGARLTSQEKKK